MSILQLEPGTCGGSLDQSLLSSQYNWSILHNDVIDGSKYINFSKQVYEQVH